MPAPPHRRTALLALTLGVLLAHALALHGLRAALQAPSLLAELPPVFYTRRLVPEAAPPPPPGAAPRPTQGHTQRPARPQASFIHPATAVPPPMPAASAAPPAAPAPRRPPKKPRRPPAPAPMPEPAPAPAPSAPPPDTAPAPDAPLPPPDPTPPAPSPASALAHAEAGEASDADEATDADEAGDDDTATALATPDATPAGSGPAPPASAPHGDAPSDPATPDMAPDTAPGTALATAAPSAPASSASAAHAHASRWPGNTRLRYQLGGHYRGELHGDAQVLWQREGARYQAVISLDVGLLLSARFTSQGDIGEHGLQPRVYEEQVRRRRRGVRIEPGGVRLNNGERLPRPDGVQDAASQLVEMAQRFATGQVPLAAGGQVRLWLARPGGVDEWVYDVLGEQTLHLPRLGPVQAVHLKPRPVSKPRGSISAEIWFAPSLQYLPVRILLTMKDEARVDLLVLDVAQD